MSPQQASDIGKHKVIGELRNEFASTKFGFYVTVLNDPPYFQQNLENLFITKGQRVVYKLPPTADRENLPVKITLREKNKLALSRFMKYENETLIVDTDMATPAGRYQLEVKITDGFSLEKKYEFFVDVSNLKLNHSSTWNKTQN